MKQKIMHAVFGTWKTYTAGHSKRREAARRLEMMGLSPEAARKLAF